MTSKKLLGDGTHGPGLGKSPMEGGRGGGRREKGWVPKRVWIFGNFDLGKRRQKEDPPQDSPS